VAALESADLILLGPGSLYTSILPNLLIPGIRQALVKTRARVVLLLNLMTQPGETDGMMGIDHFRALVRQAGEGIIDAVLVNAIPIPPFLTAHYAETGSVPVAVDRAALADDEDLLTRLFQYRFPNGSGLLGHSFGNLFLTALTGITGDFHQAILTAESLLSVRGKIFPATLNDVRLRGRGGLGADLRGGVGDRPLGRGAGGRGARSGQSAGLPASGGGAGAGGPDPARPRLALHLDPPQPADPRHPPGAGEDPGPGGAAAQPDDPARRD